jgi:hypothetical protein
MFFRIQRSLIIAYHCSPTVRAQSVSLVIKQIIEGLPHISMMTLMYSVYLVSWKQWRCSNLVVNEAARPKSRLTS